MIKNFPEELKTLLENESLKRVNLILKQKTGISNFFKTINDKKNFLGLFSSENGMVINKNRAMGDFQTPIHLTDWICNYLFKNGHDPLILLEPTCGTGNFIISALKSFPNLQHVYGIEIQRDYGWLFKLNLLRESINHEMNVTVEFHQDNIFTHAFSKNFMNEVEKNPGRLLILGNPPWITNTELSVLNSNNMPEKSNIKGHKGIEAITGRGNFDIAEYIIIQLIKKFSNYQGTIAMLCKTSVIKNIMKDLDNLNLTLSNIKSLRIDAKKEFGINAKAALFTADFGRNHETHCLNSSLFHPEKKYNIFGWIQDKFVSDIKTYERSRFMDGKSPFTWRQGIKHDAVKIMVIKEQPDGSLVNGLNEIIEIEKECLYPFVKSSDIRKKILKTTNKRIIITQSSLKDNTDKISRMFPKLWEYLLAHSEYLDNRKSVIYKNRPRFSMFGIGGYAFKSFKVAISGFYKVPIFCLLAPVNGKPVFLDDTCYYLSFESLNDALFTWVLLNRKEVKNFLKSIVFLDSKRPYTKEKLMRINLGKLLERIPPEELISNCQKHARSVFNSDITTKDLILYKQRLLIND
ncbi:MAG: hypothetical protein ACXQS8_03765 [Candidatus Helarchaeales archaeon]